MPATIKSIPFSETWWTEFIENSGNMTYPIVVKDAIKDDVDSLKTAIYEMVQNLQNENTSIAWRVWVNGKLDNKMKKQIVSDPILNHDDLLHWQNRNFGNKKFGIILNNAQRYSEKSRNLVSKYFKPFIEKKAPFGGINFSVFIGNYGWTPIGIHEDHTGSFVMHFHLGPGDKTMYMWERSNYKENLNGLDNEEHPEGYIPFADYTCHFKTGDVFFMPWNYYHIGKSDELSLGLTVWFNYTTVDGLLNGVWESGLKELSEEELSDELIQNINSLDDSTAIDRILSQLDEEIDQININDFIDQQLEDYSEALKSSNWYDSGDIKLKKENVELCHESKVKINKSAVRFKRSGDQIKIYHRGDKVSFYYHKDIEILLNSLNEGKTLNVGEALKNLFADWPDEVSLRLVEILCENDILLVIKN
jgi:hypothetical protein